MPSRDIIEYDVYQKPKDAGELQMLLTGRGAEGWSLWPLISQNGDGGGSFLIFSRETKVWDTPWDERVDKMMGLVIDNLFDPEVLDDDGRDKLRKVVNFVMNEC